MCGNVVRQDLETIMLGNTKKLGSKLANRCKRTLEKRKIKPRRGRRHGTQRGGKQKTNRVDSQKSIHN